jgi:hypothetical protein
MPLIMIIMIMLVILVIMIVLVIMVFMFMLMFVLIFILIVMMMVVVSLVVPVLLVVATRVVGMMVAIMFPFVVVGGGCGRGECSGAKPKQGGGSEANYGCAKHWSFPSLITEGRVNARALLMTHRYSYIWRQTVTLRGRGGYSWATCQQPPGAYSTAGPSQRPMSDRVALAHAIAARTKPLQRFPRIQQSPQAAERLRQGS